jgi:PglZ domain
MASLSQIRAQVANILRKSPEAHVIGIRTVNGWKGTTDIRVNERDFRVIHCVSELQIREALLNCSAKESVVIVTNLEEGDLARDIVARLARRRLHSIDGWTILKDLFQAREIDPSLLRRPWLADLVMDILPPEGVPPVPAGVLDSDTVWSIILRRSLGFDSSRPDAQDLLRWSLDGGNVARLGKLAPDVQSAVRTWISECAGKSADAIFDCVDAGFGTDAFSFGLALRAVFANGTNLEQQAAAVRFERYTGGKSLSRDVAYSWAEAARGLFDGLEAAGNDQLLLMFVERSDRILKDVRADRFAWLSEFSRIGFELRLDHFGQAVSTLLKSEIREVASEVYEAAELVRSHRFAARLQSRANQVEMAVRLLQWLAAGAGVVNTEKAQSFEDAVNTYAREGGFVDWARQCLFYGDPTVSLSTAYSQLCELVTQYREKQNRRFAELMSSWMELGCRSETIVLIENVLKTAVLPVAQVAPVLLIIVDGMSFAVYRELIEDISRNGWAELTRKGEVRKPSIATLPSVTEVSRRTLLSGKLTSGTGEDEKKNFAAQADLVQVSKPGAPPILFQKSDLTDAGDSSLAVELRREIASPKRRVVAAIVNAVDDHLLKGEQVAVPWTLRHIPVLSHLLAAAMESGRLVIMTSDHGHVLDRQTLYRPSTAGERFRIDDGNVEADEICIAGSRVVLPEGKLIVPWSEKVRYGGKRNGYHGGASPQECVIPVAVLGWPNSIPEGFEALPAFEPDWWRIGGVEPTSITSLNVATPVAEPQYSTEGQVELPFDGTLGPRTWIDRLIDSSVFAQQVAVAGRSAPPVERIRRFLFALDERGGTILRQALAQKLGEPELRIPGLIAALRRILNVDGYPVLSVEDTSGSIILNRQLLEVQFEMTQGEANNA